MFWYTFDQMFYCGGNVSSFLTHSTKWPDMLYMHKYIKVYTYAHTPCSHTRLCKAHLRKAHLRKGHLQT